MLLLLLSPALALGLESDGAGVQQQGGALAPGRAEDAAAAVVYAEVRDDGEPLRIAVDMDLSVGALDLIVVDASGGPVT